MADNTVVKNGVGGAVFAATDELSDTSQSPKVTLLDGSGSPTGISPATSGKQDAQATLMGAVNETPPASDIASAGLNGRLARVAQNLTTLTGVKTTAVTALGAGGSGILGWLSQIWDRLGAVQMASAGTKANVSASASSVTLLASNTARKLAIIANESSSLLYVDLTGGTATSTSYSVILPPAVGGVPSVLTVSKYTGLITGIWATAAGFARVTESY